MYLITMKIEGMSCSMCEAHINDVIRRVVPGAKKVKSSHVKGESSFVAEKQPEMTVLERAIEDTGYNVLSVSAAPFEKKRFGLF